MIGLAKSIARKAIRAVAVARHAPGHRKEEFPPDFSEEDIDTVRAVAPYTMTSPERIYALLRAVEYLSESRIRGDFVECGVWKGGSTMAAAMRLLKLGDTSRALYLFDTFEGMTPPAEVDKTYLGEKASDLLELKKHVRLEDHVWAVSHLRDVEEAVGGVGYPGVVKYVKGDVLTTIPAQAPDQIALLRLDTDWYDSTYHEMVHLFPRLVNGGVIIIDDYGHWLGARAAVDRYFSENRISMFLSRIDYTGRIGIKRN